MKTTLDDIQARESRYELHTYKRQPVAFVRGKGPRLFDVDSGSISASTYDTQRKRGGASPGPMSIRFPSITSVPKSTVPSLTS